MSVQLAPQAWKDAWKAYRDKNKERAAEADKVKQEEQDWEAANIKVRCVLPVVD